MYKINQEQFAKLPDELKALYVKLPNPSSEEVRECFPETTTNGVKTPFVGGASKGINLGGGNVKPYETNSGNASRFFKSIIYQAKASKSERNKGCEGLEEKQKAGAEFRPNHQEKANNGETGNPFGRWNNVVNNHPTVKPIALMEYLIKMVTPKGGIVLDPFAGSGSTLVAAKQNGFNYVGIEMIDEYVDIIKARLK